MGCDSNQFANVMIQCTAGTPATARVIYIKHGNDNSFIGINFTDAANCSDTALRIDSGVYNTVIGSGHRVYLANYVVDNGIRSYIQGISDISWSGAAN
jgi:hypothetical protein